MNGAQFSCGNIRLRLGRNRVPSRRLTFADSTRSLPPLDAQTVALQLEPPAVLTFWLRSGSDPLPAVLTTLLRCLTEDLCVPAYEVAPSGLAPGCIPAATNTYGAAEFSVWPPLQDTGAPSAPAATARGVRPHLRSTPLTPSQSHPNASRCLDPYNPSPAYCINNTVVGQQHSSRSAA